MFTLSSITEETCDERGIEAVQLLSEQLENAYLPLLTDENKTPSLEVAYGDNLIFTVKPTFVMTEPTIVYSGIKQTQCFYHGRNCRLILDVNLRVLDTEKIVGQIHQAGCSAELICVDVAGGGVQRITVGCHKPVWVGALTLMDTFALGMYQKYPAFL